MRVLVVLLLLALAACAEPAGSGADATPSSTAASDDDLLIEVDQGDGTAPERYTLQCGEQPGGDHPDAAAACEQLEGLDEPFAPLPADMMCTEQYGGPQTARITGRWHGEPVELELSRTDGCKISQWQGLGPVLPPVEGAAVPN